MLGLLGSGSSPVRMLPGQLRQDTDPHQRRADILLPGLAAAAPVGHERAGGELASEEEVGAAGEELEGAVAGREHLVPRAHGRVAEALLDGVERVHPRVARRRDPGARPGPVRVGRAPAVEAGQITTVTRKDKAPIFAAQPIFSF